MSAASSNETLNFFIPPNLRDARNKKGKLLSRSEMKDRALNYLGRAILAQKDNNSPIFELAPSDDWECLHVEDPESYNKIIKTAGSLLQQQGIEPPYELTDVPVPLATVHDISEARARRAEEARQSDPIDVRVQTAVQPYNMY